MLSSAFNDGGGSYPSWEDSFKYKPLFSSGESSGADSSEQWKQALSLAAKRLAQSSADKEDKYRKQVEFGSAIASSLNEGPDKYTKIYTPAQQAPISIAGTPGEPGLLEQVLPAAVSAGIGLLSDVRFKENIEKTGVSASGVNVYRWNYVGSPRRYQGVIAQEVPWACINKDGVQYVDYSKVDVKFKEITL